MTQTILVVDDNEANRTLLAEVLSTEGYSVTTASSGEEALEKFAETAADLVLLDVIMPGLQGDEVCRRLKANPETRLTPVVLVTALTAVEDRVRGLEANADDFLSKPIERNELLARVRSLLRQKAYTDELERAESVLLALARSIEGKDPYTKGHCERLAKHSVQLGRQIGLAEEELTALRRQVEELQDKHRTLDERLQDLEAKSDNDS